MDMLDNVNAPAGNGTQSRVATMADLAGYAPLASPNLTGIPTAPTPATGNNSTRIATTAFVNGFAVKKINYSTSEQDTGITWIDGKKIYQKTIDFGNLPAVNTQKNVEHNISNLANVIKIEGWLKNSSNTFDITSCGTFVYTFCTNTLLCCYSLNTSMPTYSSYITLFYTCTDR